MGELWANVKGHRTPDRGRGFDCGWMLCRSWRLEREAGQGFGVPPCVCPAWAQSKWGSSPLYENQKP